MSRTDTLTVYVRDRSGTHLKELRAVGTIDVPPVVVWNVLSDFDAYRTFMPYTGESRVLNRDANTRTTLVYLKLNPPLVGPRDVTIRVQEESSEAADGSSTYATRWKADNAAGPAPQAGVTRMSLDEGSWLLEPIANARATKATYSLFTDAGGNLPAFIINMANKRSVADLFDAVRNQVQKNRYRQKEDAAEPGG